MKRILLLFVVCFFTLQSDIYAGNNNECIETSEIYTIHSSSTGLTTYEILVYATDIVDDLCNSFNGSALDAGLSIYCKFVPGSTTCLVYKAVSVACGINGTVRLVLKGEYNAALYKAVITASKTFTVTKENGRYVIK